MNASDVAYALNLDLDAISRRLHDPETGPHMQDIETLLYALHSLRESLQPTYTPVPIEVAHCPGCGVGEGSMHNPECPVRALNMRAFYAGRWPHPWNAELEAEEQALDHFAADRTPG